MDRESQSKTLSAEIELREAAVEAVDWMSRCGPFLEAVFSLAEDRSKALKMILEGGEIRQRLIRAIEAEVPDGS